jgi:hypothetical protein
MTIKEFKRFFEPVKKQKFIIFLYISFSIYTAFFWLYSIEILKKITNAIEI